MKFTKEAEKVYKKLKAQGYTDKEIAENYVFPVGLTEKEKLENQEIMNKIREGRQAKMTDEEKTEINELAEKFRKENEDGIRDNK